MRIILEKIGKRYNNEWVFRNLNCLFVNGRHYVLSGPNGSGKSTLLNIISSRVIPDEGSLVYDTAEGKIKAEEAFRYISVCSPYIELIEEFTLEENIDFFLKFRRLQSGVSAGDLKKIIGLSKIKNKKIHQFSSGMKQRLKLAMTLYSDSNFVLLDEPCTGLDEEGIIWYKEIIGRCSEGRTIIVGSNDKEHEFFFCTETIRLQGSSK